MFLLLLPCFHFCIFIKRCSLSLSLKSVGVSLQLLAHKTFSSARRGSCLERSNLLTQIPRQSVAVVGMKNVWRLQTLPPGCRNGTSFVLAIAECRPRSGGRDARRKRKDTSGSSRSRNLLLRRSSYCSLGWIHQFKSYTAPDNYFLNSHHFSVRMHKVTYQTVGALDVTSQSCRCFSVNPSDRHQGHLGPAAEQLGLLLVAYRAGWALFCGSDPSEGSETLDVGSQS